MAASVYICIRRELRLLVVAALRAQIRTATIKSPGIWPTAPDKLPVILVRVVTDRKESVMRGNPQFTTTVTVQVDARVWASTQEAAQDAMEELSGRIEYAIWTDFELNKVIQQTSSVDTKVDVTADGEQHAGTVSMLFGLETYEVFDVSLSERPNVTPLEGIDVTVDTVEPSDKTGTYPDPAFPDSVNPAPRTEGPDGRAEGTLQIDLPQP